VCDYHYNANTVSLYYKLRNWLFIVCSRPRQQQNLWAWQHSRTTKLTITRYCNLQIGFEVRTNAATMQHKMIPNYKHTYLRCTSIHYHSGDPWCLIYRYKMNSKKNLRVMTLLEVDEINYSRSVLSISVYRSRCIGNCIDTHHYHNLFGSL
jgi:hypothetical protein